MVVCHPDGYIKYSYIASYDDAGLCTHDIVIPVIYVLCESYCEVGCRKDLVKKRPDFSLCYSSPSSINENNPPYPHILARFSGRKNKQNWNWFSVCVISVLHLLNPSVFFPSGKKLADQPLLTNRIMATNWSSKFYMRCFATTIDPKPLLINCIMNYKWSPEVDNTKLKLIKDKFINQKLAYLGELPTLFPGEVAEIPGCNRSPAPTVSGESTVYPWEVHQGGVTQQVMSDCRHGLRILTVIKIQYHI